MRYRPQILWVLMLLALVNLFGYIQAQSDSYYMRIEIDTSQLEGDPMMLRSIRAGHGIDIPANGFEIPLNEHQRATYRQDRDETFLSAVNMMNQVTIKFKGNSPGEYTLPEIPSNSPKVRVFLADMKPILDGNIVSGKVVVTHYEPGKYIKGTFHGKEKVAGYDLYFAIKGMFYMPATIR